MDEVSMLAEVFYKFLMMIKKFNKDIKFIISGDYNQLKAINDRILPYTDYSNSPALFELADRNKIQFTKCRRADSKPFDLIQFNNIPKGKPSDFTEIDNYDNDINICLMKHVNMLTMLK